MIRYLSVEQVLSLHQGLIGPLSGDAGIRELAPLESAVARPSLAFEGEDLYPTLEAKAAALLQALVAASPFDAANDATALLAAEVFLLANGRTLQASDRDLERMVSLAAAGEGTREPLTIWLRQRMRG